MTNSSSPQFLTPLGETRKEMLPNGVKEVGSLRGPMGQPPSVRGCCGPRHLVGTILTWCKMNRVAVPAKLGLFLEHDGGGKKATPAWLYPLV